jgi:hypothetical protein
MKISCVSPSVRIPNALSRVVCTLWVTIATLYPIMVLIRVDLPTLGGPINAMFAVFSMSYLLLLVFLNKCI